MKKTILFPLLVTVAFVTTGYAQQRPSQTSFTSVMNQVKQKQIARDKMIQQVKQTTPSSAGQMQLQATGSTDPAPTQQRSQPVQRTNQQPVINKQTNQQQGKIKKE